MKTLLKIDSSIRLNNSFSRALGDHFLTCWCEKHPTGKIISRDLHTRPVPHLTEATVQAFFGGPASYDNLALSDELINEINVCDEILITCPMYNFHIPSSLKAYLDHVVRVNKTFQYTDGKYKGLLTNKRCYLLTTMGGKKNGSMQNTGVENYLRNILEFIGINDTVLFCIDGTADLNYATPILAETKMKITNSISIL